ncbi:MAG: hypothetical protein HQM08_19595 [Candidatus Riflebacteria bacterium]|nr:hypothetical protein [Candidatus Riflebacteria bacterium]
MSGMSEKAGVPVKECLRYSMNLPANTIVVGMESMQQLKENLAVAHSFKPMTEEEMEALRKRTAKVGNDGKLEIYKTTRQYGGIRGKNAHGMKE